MLWVKVLFYGLAIDGVGTFIFMTAEIIKGLKYFIGLLATLFISFAVAFMVLFRCAGLQHWTACCSPSGPQPCQSPPWRSQALHLLPAIP